MLSAEGFFFTFKKVKGLPVNFEHIFENKVSALGRLTFDENLLTRQATSIRCLH